MDGSIDSAASLLAAAEEIGATIAAPIAEEVDRDARFPHEAVQAMRERGLLGALVPSELGGPGLRLCDVTAAVRVLARHCSATALVLGMHTVEAANLVRHGTTEPLRALQRELVAAPFLFANANSEVGSGGDVSRSRCAIEQVDGRSTLTKEALAISYGAHADVICGTARRAPDAEETDQVLAICRRFTLEPISEWDSIGLRGTCSQGFRLTAELDPELAYPVPFSVIGSTGGLHSMMMLLSGVWVGIADSCGATAHACVRAAARRSLGSLPPSAVRLAELSERLDEVRALLEATGVALENAFATGQAESPAVLAQLRNLKVGTSRGAVDIARMALEICGIAAFKRDSPFSLDRQLRDAHGGLVMVGNDRYLHANAQMLVARKQL